MEPIYINGMTTEVKEGENAVEKLVVASDSTVDRQGESISVDGWQLENFKKNPVILWGHDNSIPAIGTAENIGFKTISNKKSLVFKPKFHRKSEMSRLISDLYEDGVIPAVSVGFIPKEMDSDRTTYTKQELLEISFVNVPANPNALTLAMKRGYSNEIIKSVLPDTDKVIIEAISEKSELLTKLNDLETQVKTLVDKVNKAEDKASVPATDKQGEGRKPTPALKKKDSERGVALKALNRAIERLNRVDKIKE